MIELSSKSIWPWRFLFQKILNYKFNFLNRALFKLSISYRMSCGHLYFLRNWSILYKLSILCVELFIICTYYTFDIFKGCCDNTASFLMLLSSWFSPRTSPFLLPSFPASLAKQYVYYIYIFFKRTNSLFLLALIFILVFIWLPILLFF